MPQKKLSRAAEKKYIEGKGTLCPYCGRPNFDVTTDLTEIVQGTLVQGVQCLNCGEEWRDKYTLTAVMSTETLAEAMSRQRCAKRKPKNLTA